MAAGSKSYDYIAGKIQSMKDEYPFLRNKKDDYVFSALCVKAHFYKNPTLGEKLDKREFDEIIVDGSYDGGVDILLNDPNSDNEDELIIGQSKFRKNISSQDVLQAMRKMADFYNNMRSGHYEQVSEKVQQRFFALDSEIGEESKIHFVFYTSASKGRISLEWIEKKFREEFDDPDVIKVSILFASDIEDEIKESESITATVEFGKIRIDQTGNCLWYDNQHAAIVNVSAYSIKQLYAQYGISLLALNLRYHVSGKMAGMNIDNEIRDTIQNNPESFWFKNNGLTIICDDFLLDGKEVKLRNFSIINGGQTAYVLHRNSKIDDLHDFYLSCKIIKRKGNDPNFGFEIAKAANAQKPIKPEDIRANAPEQTSFATIMLKTGVFYETKRGQKISKEYREPYQHAKLKDIGGLCLAGVFQMPGSSRSKKTLMYKDKYYAPIFMGNEETQKQMAKICKDLLYIDYYFGKFRIKFEQSNKDALNSANRITFARNARTICVAFAALAGRYFQHNITDQTVIEMTAEKKSEPEEKSLRRKLCDFGSLSSLLPVPSNSNIDMDMYDRALDQLFTAIIEEGSKNFSRALRFNQALNASNFLKDDKNYYDILLDSWDDFLKSKINLALSVFDGD